MANTHCEIQLHAQQSLCCPAGALLVGVVSGLLSVFGYSVITPAIEDSIGLQVLAAFC